MSKHKGEELDGPAKRSNISSEPSGTCTFLSNKMCFIELIESKQMCKEIYLIIKMLKA